MRPQARTILKAVTEQYLSSGDFNGTSVDEIQATEEKRREVLSEMVRAKTISVEFGDRHPNPFIKAFAAEAAAAQLKTLTLKYACLYPMPKHLKTVVKLRSTTGSRSAWSSR